MLYFTLATSIFLYQQELFTYEQLKHFFEYSDLLQLLLFPLLAIGQKLPRSLWTLDTRLPFRQ